MMMVTATMTTKTTTTTTTMMMMMMMLTMRRRTTMTATTTTTTTMTMMKMMPNDRNQRSLRPSPSVKCVPDGGCTCCCPPPPPRHTQPLLHQTPSHTCAKRALGTVVSWTSSQMTQWGPIRHCTCQLTGSLGREQVARHAVPEVAHHPPPRTQGKDTWEAWDLKKGD